MLEDDRASGKRKAFHFLMQPVVRYLLKHSFSFQEFILLAKEVYVAVARDEIKKETTKVNISRLSAVTGLHRYDVKQILESKEEAVEEHTNRLTRVLVRWSTSKKYTTQAGKPRILSYSGETNEFAELVAGITQSIGAGTILFELERLGSVEKTPRGLKMIRPTLWVGNAESSAFELLGADIQTLISSVEENVVTTKGIANLHIRSDFDNLYLDGIPEVRKWLVVEGRNFHKRARDFIAAFDKDINPDVENPERPAGGTATFTAFSLTSKESEGEVFYPNYEKLHKPK